MTLALAPQTPCVEFWRGGDDGLTLRFFDELAAENSQCPEGSLRVLLDQIRPDHEGSFAYRVSVSEEDMDAPVWSTTGTCREADLIACARDASTKVHGFIASREGGSDA
ncbi:hypothetical protein [Brevundimonas sp. A19_0]|uniref:hypothetical protein n=1 Tax=Brevundimonas sp. A19_0 TaxID=2821087 RepID=UPI001ADC2253|nr:hypothetical protein [Brevundimonas sp. A19_0]MBO9502250.1 hypothetical protein [Brevundimonas sp. A19_0]